MENQPVDQLAIQLVEPPPLTLTKEHFYAKFPQFTDVAYVEPRLEYDHELQLSVALQHTNHNARQSIERLIQSVVQKAYNGQGSLNYIELVPHLTFGEEQYITIAKVIDDKTIQVKEDLSDWLGSFDDDGRLIVDTTTSTITPEEYEALETDKKEGYDEKDDVYEKTTTSYPGSNLYVRGERVNDFRTLKKEMLFAINFSATQDR